MRRLAPVALLLLLVFFVPSAGAWTWPVSGPLLQTFSFDQAHPYAAGQRRGIAIGADQGAPVLAPAGGVVSFAGTVASNGQTVTIQTPSGLAVSLTHLGSVAVKGDDAVAEGAVIGTVGPSGTAEFEVPYVHLGIRDAGNPQGYLDPLAFLPVAAAPVAAPAPAPPPVQAPAPPPPAETPRTRCAAGRRAGCGARREACARRVGACDGRRDPDAGRRGACGSTGCGARARRGDS